MNTSTQHVGPLYLVEVHGANGSPAQIGKYGEEVRAHTSGRTEWCAAVVFAYVGARAPYAAADGSERRRVALFSSRRAAEIAVADGEIWNDQTYRIRAARGEQLREGVVISSYQAPCRPRRDPTAARTTKTLRCHPDTWARIEAEASRTKDGSGLVVDRLAAILPLPATTSRRP